MKMAVATLLVLALPSTAKDLAVGPIVFSGLLSLHSTTRSGFLVCR